MRPLPDPDLSLRDASDFIFGSNLCRRTLLSPQPPYIAVFLHDLISAIYRLTVSCHLAEFTDHGLHHLCSLVDRISNWTVSRDASIAEPVIEFLEPCECGILLLATLFHDIGMLSQRPEDLPQQQLEWNSKGVENVPDWVRSTHIGRMESLVKRLFLGSQFKDILDDDVLIRAFRVAKAHGKWPAAWSSLNFPQRDAALAAILAVADLLDEDSNRCDINTLLRHRLGTHLNCAHWIRHGLTFGRILVSNGVINVSLRRPPDTDVQLVPVYRAIRNHYRLCLLFRQELAKVDAGNIKIVFSPEDGCPEKVADELKGWDRLQGFRTPASFVYHLLNSFFSEALLDSRRVSTEKIQKLRLLGLQEIDLTEFHRIRGGLELHSHDEQAFQVLLGEAP